MHEYGTCRSAGVPYVCSHEYPSCMHACPNASCIMRDCVSLRAQGAGRGWHNEEDRPMKKPQPFLRSTAELLIELPSVAVRTAL